MRYTSRGMRRRRNTDKWEVTLSHHDPVTGKQVSTYHTVKAKTEKQAQRKRDELTLELERKGGAAGSKATVEEFMSSFLAQLPGVTFTVEQLEAMLAQAKRVDEAQ